MSKKKYEITTRSYNIDPDARTISVTKGFWKEAGLPHTQAAERMLHWQQVYPHFTTIVKEHTSNKQSHKRLTESFMKRYISTRTDNKAVMKEFEALKILYMEERIEIEDSTIKSKKELAKKERADKLVVYTKLKSWFLEKYPNYADSKAFAKYISKNAIIEEQGTEANIMPT